MKKYNVIYADPPWSYDSVDVPVIERSIGLTKIDNYYANMKLSDIMAMPVKVMTEKDSVCFIWATVPLLPEALQVLSAWGFKYKTMITWHKTNSKGMGYWFRGYTEHILLGVKGSPKAFKSLSKNIYDSKVGKHSQKPHYFRQLISDSVKKSFNEPKKLELFARSREGFFPDYEYEGWDVFGNQVNNSIQIPV